MVRRFACAVLLAVAAIAPSRVFAADVVAVVPFAAPGTEKVQVVDDATGILTTRLTEKGVTPKTLDPVNRFTAVATAPQICARTGATGILVPTMRTEQHVQIKNYVLVSVTTFATHVELRLERLRCDGTVAWTGVTTADKDYTNPLNANVQAGVSDAVNQAIGKALDAYAARPAETPAVLAAAPAVAAQPGTKVAIVPFTQLGSEADPSLDFATDEAKKRFAARGADVVVTDQLDHLAAAKDAAGTCARYGASKIVMGTLRTEQTPKSFGMGTHAEILLSTLDCSGAVIASYDAIGEHLHHGANFRAGVSSAIEDAFGHWAEAQAK